MKVKLKNNFDLNYQKNTFRSWFYISAILLLAVILYVYQLDTESLWIDEIFSIRAVNNKSFLNFNRALYFLLLYFWMYLGKSEAWLRGLSVLFGLGSVWLTYLLGCRLFNKPTGLIAALLLTLSPLAINHSQEVRMYMLSMFLGLSGSLVLTYWLERPNILSGFGWLSLRILAILTTSINILLLLPDTLILGWRFRRQGKRISIIFRKWFWLLSILIIPAAVIIKDVVPPLLAFLEGKTFDHQIGISAFVGGITRFTIWHLESPIEQLSWFYEEIFFNLYALVLLILLGFAWFKRKNSIGLFWATAWGFCPLIVLFLLSQIFTTLWGTDRYLLFTAPYVFIILAAGLIRVWHWRRTLAFLIIGIYAIAISGALVNYYTVQNREDWRGVAQTISIQEQPNDAIALFPDKYLPGLTYYYQGVAPIHTIEFLPKEKLFKPIDEPSLEKMLSNLPEFESRLWLVFAFAHTSVNDNNQIIPSVLNRWFDVELQQQFTGIELFLLKSNPKKDGQIKLHSLPTLNGVESLWFLTIG